MLQNKNKLPIFLMADYSGTNYAGCARRLVGRFKCFVYSLERIINTCRNAPETFESSKLDARRELIQHVLQNLELHERQLRWEHKKPFDMMAFCKKIPLGSILRSSSNLFPA